MSLAFTCTECVNSDGGIAIMVAVAILILCVGMALCKHLVSGERDGAHEGIIGRFIKHLPLQSIKIVVVVWQIVTQASTHRPQITARNISGGTVCACQGV